MLCSKERQIPEIWHFFGSESLTFVYLNLLEEVFSVCFFPLVICVLILPLSTGGAAAAPSHHPAGPGRALTPDRTRGADLVAEAANCPLRAEAGRPMPAPKGPSGRKAKPTPGPARRQRGAPLAAARPLQGGPSSEAPALRSAHPIESGRGRGPWPP